jgi:hypothetical protein
MEIKTRICHVGDVGNENDLGMRAQSVLWLAQNRRDLLDRKVSHFFFDLRQGKDFLANVGHYDVVVSTIFSAHLAKPTPTV